MEDIVRKKDATPYLVFACKKCHNFIHVKTTQKSKKCTRCGYTHQVSKIIHQGEIIKGVSSAVELVKKKQNDLAIEELGSEPEFRTSNDFKITRKVQNRKKCINFDQIDNNYSEKFKQLLYNLSKMHKTFPYYTIEIMAENSGIPSSEVKILTRKLLREGFLLKINGDYLYKIRL